MARSQLRITIEAIVKRWVPILGLQDWDVEVRFDERKHQATCRAQPEYEDAILRFNLPCIRREIKTAARLEDLVVHELCHCLTWGSRKAQVDERETTHVARAILRAAGSRR